MYDTLTGYWRGGDTLALAAAVGFESMVCPWVSAFSFLTLIGYSH